MNTRENLNFIKKGGEIAIIFSNEKKIYFGIYLKLNRSINSYLMMYGTSTDDVTTLSPINN